MGIVGAPALGSRTMSEFPNLKGGVYPDDWLDHEDIPCKQGRWENVAKTYEDRDGRVHTFIGCVRRPKTRGAIDRETWMCQMFGADWRTNSRVAPHRNTSVL